MPFRSASEHDYACWQRRLAELKVAPGSEITVRVVSNVRKEQPVSKEWAQRYGTPGQSMTMPYNQKMLFAFYNTRGHDVAFFGLIVARALPVIIHNMMPMPMIACPAINDIPGQAPHERTGGRGLPPLPGVFATAAG